MRTFPALVAAPIALALAISGNAARADDAKATTSDSSLPPLPPSTTTAAAPAPTPTPAPNVQTATTASGQVVIVAQSGDPNFQLRNPAKKTKRVWYGWQTLAFDGAAIVGGASLAAAGTDFGGWVWVGTYTLAPPIVHIGHGRVGIAFADLGVRVGAPFVTTLIGAAIGCQGSSADFQNVSNCAAGIVVGFLVGYASAVAIDAAVFARETVPVDDSDEARELAREKRKRASTFTVLPDLGLNQNRATLGLHGMF